MVTKHAQNNGAVLNRIKIEMESPGPVAPLGYATEPAQFCKSLSRPSLPKMNLLALPVAQTVHKNQAWGDRKKTL